MYCAFGLESVPLSLPTISYGTSKAAKTIETGDLVFRWPLVSNGLFPGVIAPCPFDSV